MTASTRPQASTTLQTGRVTHRRRFDLDSVEAAALAAMPEATATVVCSRCWHPGRGLNHESC
ncbi:hypothetical protein [Nocardia cyriacigeorgica]|uniref:hypothetical protein n=1 Tax=Nocardia cyriacigeorgica TaxID=135487 RepID=UPI002454A865|nr:hypothetical protein [Nocardia cyriacigeorgica]